MDAAINTRILREAIEDGTYCPVCKVPWSDCDCEDRSPCDPAKYPGEEDSE